MRLRGRRDGAAAATYAAVLDGVHLWLDLDGPVSVRDADSKAVTELGEHPCRPGRRSPGRPTTCWPARPRSGSRSPASSPARTPLAPDGTTRWEVVRLDDGRLRLTRHTVAATAELDAVDVRGDRVHLRIRPPGGVEPGCHLLLLDTDDQVLRDAARHRARGAGRDADRRSTTCRPATSACSGSRSARTRRGSGSGGAANDLADPHHAVLLPELYELGPDQARARLRWNPDGLLALRSIDPDEAG